ncbi:MAG: serine/threonine-protein phosphatase [Firmicutes bacterium]|nr:serine/threonine-protein phosphatase [Bacillota bacterium]
MIDSPFLISAGFLMGIFILFLIRHFLMNTRKKPEIIIGNAQSIGARSEQEDSFTSVINEHGVMAALADGMGGYSNGKMASSLVVNLFVKEFTKKRQIEPVDKFFHDTLLLSNEKLLEKAKEKKTGTTMVVVVISEGYLSWASVGDSAIALFRNQEFQNLNQKQIFQTMLEKEYLSGHISKEEVLNNPKKKRLTNYIGHENFHEIITSKRAIKLQHGDRIILCSDGVYNSITEIEMEKALMKNLPPDKAAEEIINIIKAKNIKNQDNATIIILEKNNSK